MTMQTWFEKASLLDIKGRCQLLWCEENSFYDLIVTVQDQQNEPGRTFYVHKLILAMGSRTFASKLYNGLSQTDSLMTSDQTPFELNIQTLSSSLMSLVIEFLYTDEIKASLEWPVVGGLVYAAKQLGIPRLEEFCTNLFQDKLSCERIVTLFQQLSILTSKECRWPKQYYLELISMCYTYVLRNGEVILRSKNFLQLSYRCIASVISSDFFVCEEITIYNALKRWAKSQCKKRGLSVKEIENIRKMLRLPTDSDQSLGLLKHVRFPLIDSETFSLKIHKSSSSLISNKVAEKVYQHYLTSKPTGMFQETKRYSEIRSEITADFKQHVEELCQLIAPQIFHQTDIDNVWPNGCSSVLSTSNPGTKILPTSRNSEYSGMNCEIQKSRSNTVLSLVENSNSLNRGECTVMQRYPIKIERSSDDENVSQSNLVITNSQNHPRTPLSYSNRDRMPLVKDIKIEPGTSTLLLKRKEPSIKKEGESNIANKAIKLSIEDGRKCVFEKRELYIEDVNSSNPSYSQDQVYKKSSQKMSFLKIIEECTKVPLIRKISIEDIEIENFGILKKSCPSICLPNVKDFLLSVNMRDQKQENFIQNLFKINLEQYIFFYQNDEKIQNRLSELWTNKVRTKFTVNGVSLLEINVPKLTLNYSQNTSFFILNEQTLYNIKILNLGNCKLPNKHFLNKSNAMSLLELRLLRVNELKLEPVLRECVELRILSVWSNDNLTPTLCLDDLQSDNINYLSVFGHTIKFNLANKREFAKIKEICLCDCSFDPSFVDNIASRFPNLKKIYAMGRFGSSPNLLKTLLSMKSIEEVSVWNFDVNSLESKSFIKLKNLIENFKFKKSSNGLTSFKIQRNSNVDSEWNGINVTSKDLKNQIYKSFGFENFYTFDWWAKEFWSVYDLYY